MNVASVTLWVLGFLTAVVFMRLAEISKDLKELRQLLHRTAMATETSAGLLDMVVGNTRKIADRAKSASGQD